MKSLGNGRYEITNDSTGEKRVVTAQELPQYGLEAPVIKLAKKAQTVQTSKKKDKSIPFVSGAIPLVTSAIGQRLGGQMGSKLGLIGGPTAPILSATGYGAGSIAGGSIGNVAGKYISNAVEDVGAGEPINISDVDARREAKSGAISSALGMGIGKLLGLAAHPIKPFVNSVNKRLASSSKVIDVGNILAKYRNEVLPDFTRKTIGREATDEYKKLAPDIISAVAESRPHTSTGPDVASQKLPVATVNELKRNLSGSVKRYYGGDSGKVAIESRKQMARLLKEALEAAEPGIKIPNKVASTLYKVPNLLESLSYLVPGRGATAARMVGSAPFKATQAVLPYGGGYLNYLLPAIIKLAEEQRQAEQNQYQQ